MLWVSGFYSCVEDSLPSLKVQIGLVFQKGNSFGQCLCCRRLARCCEENSDHGPQMMSLRQGNGDGLLQGYNTLSLEELRKVQCATFEVHPAYPTTG